MAIARATVGAMCWLPFSWYTRQGIESIRTDLSIIPKYDADKTPIISYVETDDAIGVPIKYGVVRATRYAREKGLKIARLIRYDEVEGAAELRARKLPDPNHPKAAKGQGKFIDDIKAALENYSPVLAAAGTGTGKTVSALSVAAQLGKATLVIVPSKFLASQWIKEAKRHLGLPPEEIGIVEEGVAKYKGRSLVVAVVHNLAQKKWSDTFRSYFGFVIWDEAHRLGARSFSTTLQLFPSRYKLALTATPDRRDGCAPLFLNYFGMPRVRLTAPAMPATAYILHYVNKRHRKYASLPRSVILNLLAASNHRNRLITRVVHRLRERGRRGILIVSDRVQHLQALMAACYDAGIPEQEMGLFVRSYVDEFGKKKSFTQADNDAVARDARLIFATYGMMKEGVDIPRLDAGIDATPRSEGTQMIGRIRRKEEGKKHPVWFTIRDVAIPCLSRSTGLRVWDYKQSGVEVIEYGKV